MELPDLPSEMWECIFLHAKMSVKSLVQLSCFHRVWRLPIFSPTFIKAYDESDSGKTGLLLVQTHLKLVYWLFSTDINSWVSFINSPLEIRGLSIVGSCRGLICFSEPYGMILNPPIYVWNPSIWRLRQLPQGHIQIEEGDQHGDVTVPIAIAIGLGFDA
ncbi:F-box/kelch-repeat protein At3g23880-like [Rosa chinensis]|uniref:F-box/kelch-repeat protein At3g23880-like n=1 Tax=Rosa chinensis TaxID=74649 RepID=UPI001AD8BE97|nr:F-box/kelch-repeat protein At3g23880-like [Rosa chinensis]